MRLLCTFITMFVAIGILRVSHAEDVVGPVAAWPKGWPKELAPLEKQTRLRLSGIAEFPSYEIAFARRDEFEAAWAHLLKVKTKGAPIVLLSAPYKYLGTNLEAGVLVNVPLTTSKGAVTPKSPLNLISLRNRWMWTTYIELIVDGDVVDLNRIPLPPDTPIIDKRFEGDAASSSDRRDK